MVFIGRGLLTPEQLNMNLHEELYFILQIAQSGVNCASSLLKQSVNSQLLEENVIPSS
jgi:hypothetical protein